MILVLNILIYMTWLIMKLSSSKISVEETNVNKREIGRKKGSRFEKKRNPLKETKEL